MNKEKLDKNEMKQLIISGVSFVLGTFGLAICYNLLFLPNDLVGGGVSGLGIIFNKLMGISAQAFIYIVSFILLIVCYFFLGKEETQREIIGTILYPLLITFTAPLAKILLPIFSFQEILVTVILAGVLYGISNGLVYKFGFSTGGADVIVRLMCKYIHMSEGKASLLVNSLIIICGGFVFGIDNAVYSIIILVLSSYLIDKIIIGISDSKKFMIYTRESRKVKNLISKDFKAGFTIFPTVGGYSHVKGAMIMCVIRNRDIHLFKDKILEIDPHAFFVISDCYEVQGGIRRSNIPFM